jgi:hypothetical protein
MKNLFVKTLIILFLPSLSLSAQDFSNGIDNLIEVKWASQNLARAIQLQWDHKSPEYKEAQKLYDATQSSVEQMIAAFDAKIRSGQKISDKDIKLYTQKISKKGAALIKHYNENSSSGGTPALFNVGDVIPILDKIIEGVTTVIDGVRAYQIKVRLEKMHSAFDPCKLVDWDSVIATR